jgi:peptidoglycan/LPS O-acetylase OafA/YrhL
LEISKSRLAGADGLRAIACLLVVWHHTAQKLNPQGASPIIGVLQFLGMRGEVGVSLFFVLSGCLLSLPFWRAFLRRDTFPSIKTYALNRAARIAPAFWLNLIICYALAFWVFHLELNWQKFVSAFFFVNNYNYRTFFPAELNGPLWSIGLEVSCYVLLPILLFVIFKAAKSFAVAISGLVLAILGLQILNPLTIQFFMTSDFEKGWQFGLDGGAKQWLPYWNIGSFFSQFLIGSLAALIIAQSDRKRTNGHWLFDIGALAALTSSVVLVLVRLTPGSPDALTQQPYVSPYFALLAAAALTCLSQSVVVARLLDNRLFSWIAKLSFGIYLWHMVVIEVIARQFVPNYVYGGVTDPTQWIGTSAIVLVAATAIAAVSWRWFESPILGAARKLNKPALNS